MESTLLATLSKYTIRSGILQCIFLIAICISELNIELNIQNSIYFIGIIYVLGQVLNSIGSLLEDLLLKFRIIKRKDLSDYNKYSATNSKISELNLEKNAYRTSGVTCLILCIIGIIYKFNLILIILLVLAFIILFLQYMNTNKKIYNNIDAYISNDKTKNKKI